MIVFFAKWNAFANEKSRCIKTLASLRYNILFLLRTFSSKSFLFIPVLIIDLILTNHYLILNYLFYLFKTQLTPDH